MTPRILLTSGEPAGIGPDLCVILAQKLVSKNVTVLGDPQLLLARAKQLGLPLKLRLLGNTNSPEKQDNDELNIWPTEHQPAITAGILSPENAPYVLETIQVGTHACLNGNYDALVTNPVNKASINDAGFQFSGHTEYIADITGGYPVMMLATTGLRVALATTHIPLKIVSQAITAEKLEIILRILNRALKNQFCIDNPQILVCGLNPHAGEGGHLGMEEIEVIEPVLETLRQEGLKLKGPLPADTLFLPKNLKNCDAVLAMYHDQGLPVLKSMGFGKAVNITLGLPIVRTSVDHGTALELAGTGQVDSGSLESAIDIAIEMAMNKSS